MKLREKCAIERNFDEVWVLSALDEQYTLCCKIDIIEEHKQRYIPILRLQGGASSNNQCKCIFNLTMLYKHHAALYERNT